MVGGQRVQHLAEGQYGPAVGTPPVEGGVDSHLLHPPVAEQSLLLDKHALGKLAYLAHGLVIIGSITRQAPHLRYGGNAHEHIVEPHRVLMWAYACQRAVGEAVLLLQYVVGIAVDERLHFLQLRVGEHGFDHGRADGPRVVECLRVDHLAHQRVNLHALLVHVVEAGRGGGQQSVALVGIVAVGLVARSLVGGQHGRVGDAPLVAGQSEVAPAQLRLRADLAHVGDGHARLFVF